MFLYVGIFGFMLSFLYLTFGKVYKMFVKDDGYRTV